MNEPTNKDPQKKINLIDREVLRVSPIRIVDLTFNKNKVIQVVKEDFNLIQHWIDWQVNQIDYLKISLIDFYFSRQLGFFKVRVIKIFIVTEEPIIFQILVVNRTDVVQVLILVQETLYLYLDFPSISFY